MGRTRAQLRDAVVRKLGLPLISGTSNASGNTTTLLDDDDILARYADDALIGMWLYDEVPSTPVDSVITDSAQATGVTFRPAAAAAPNSEAYEVLPFSASAIHSAIDDTLLYLFDTGLLVREFWIGGVTGSPIYNSMFDYWTTSTACHGWTTTGSITRQQGAAIKWTGEQVARVANVGATHSLDSTWRRFLTDLAGQNIRLRAWCTTSTASVLRIQIVGAATSSSPYHSGDGEWEMLEIEATLATTDLDWIPRITTDSTATQDVGEIWIDSGYVPAEHPIPIALMPGGPTAIYLSRMPVNITDRKAEVRPSRLHPWHHWRWQRYHDQNADVEFGTIVWTERPPPGMRMWVMGSGPLTLPTTTTSSVEVNQSEAELIANMVAMRLLELQMGMLPTSGKSALADRIARLQRDVSILAEGFGARTRTASLPRQWP